MKKRDVAKKMKGSANGRETVEGDQDDGALTSFNKKDIRQEKKSRAEKNGRVPKSNWEI